jgi:hypothetical protein
MESIEIIILSLLFLCLIALLYVLSIDKPYIYLFRREEKSKARDEHVHPPSSEDNSQDNKRLRLLSNLKILSWTLTVLAAVLFILSQFLLFSDHHIARTTLKGSRLLIEEIVGFVAVFSIPSLFWIVYYLFKRGRLLRVKKSINNQQERENAPAVINDTSSFPSRFLKSIVCWFTNISDNKFQLVSTILLFILLLLSLKQQFDISTLQDEVTRLSESENNLETKVDQMGGRLSSEISNAESDLSEQIGLSEKSIQESLFFIDLRR